MMLDPLHAARGEVRGRAQSGLFAHDLIGQVRDLEGEMPVLRCRIALFDHHIRWRLAIRPVAIVATEPGDGKNLAANLPHIRTAPLHHMGGGRQGGAETVEIIGCHWGKRCWCSFAKPETITA
tara:strand:+ start:574 stop:942 length:369 start_codon:yes stop_codon:yes gene_type:complete